MSSNNTNIFVGDRSYRRNFFLQFTSNRTERKFRDEAYVRTRYSLRGFLILSLIFLVFHFMTTDCFTYDHSCRHHSLVILTMLSLIGALIALNFKIPHPVIQLLTTFSSIYFNIVLIESYSYHTALVLITIYTSTLSFLVHQVWLLQLTYSLLSYGVFVFYLSVSDNLTSLYKPLLSFALDLGMYNLLTTLFLAFLEKGRKERWVLVETYKKSDRIFKQIYEDLPYAFYIIDKSKRIHYSSMQGFNLLSLYSKNCQSCNFSRININLQDILEKDSIATLEETLTKAVAPNARDEPVACFVTLKQPEEYDPQKCRFTLGKDNLYKIKITQTIWKANYAYLVVMKDYSSKKKAENITSNTISYLLKNIDNLLRKYFMKQKLNYFKGEYDQSENTKNKKELQFKSKILSKITKIKFSVLNALLIFYRIFNKNGGINDKKNFHIKNSILATVASMSFKAKEKLCDMQLKFETSSFPTEVYGDQHLFQQIFANTLYMLIDKLSNTVIEIDCKLDRVTTDGQYRLLFEFKFLKSENLAFAALSSKLETTNPASLDDILSGDVLLSFNALRFFLALIQPAVQVLDGKVDAEESNNEIILSLELLMQASGNSKERNYSEFATFKQINYNASGNPKEHIYLWKCEEPPEESHEAEQPGNLAEKPIVFQKGKVQNDAPRILPANQIEDFGKSNPRPLNKGRIDQYKVRQELQKALKGSKNFGTQEEIPNISNMAGCVLKTSCTSLVSMFSKEEEGSNSEQKKNVSDAHEEEKEFDDGVSSNISQPFNLPLSARREPDAHFIPPINNLQIDLGYERMTSIPSSTSIPEFEAFNRVIPGLRIHHYTLKMAITKALMEIIDDQRREEFKKGTRITTLLEGITVEERVEGLEIKESELCERALKYLSGRLTSEKRCEEFMAFASQYASILEDEICKLQTNEDNDQPYVSVYYSSPNGKENIETTATDSPRGSTINSHEKKGQSRIAIKTQPSRDSSFSKDSDRSKERNLNGRFFLSPSINRTMTLKSALSLTAKSAKDQLLPYLMPPDLKSSKSAPRLPHTNPDQMHAFSELELSLLPFSNLEHLPAFLLARTVTNKRKWAGAPNEITNTPEKTFIYNEVFTILAVDDSEFVFKALESLPIKYKKKFEFAKNGTEALKKYLSNINQGILYHMVLLDLQMPVMDGFETARVIRAEEVNKNYPPTYICAMSAFEDKETFDRAKKEGMDNFCQKPLRMELLNNLIKLRCEQIGIKLPD